MNEDDLYVQVNDVVRPATPEEAANIEYVRANMVGPVISE
jgi:hypothetical protein